MQSSKSFLLHCPNKLLFTAKYFSKLSVMLFPTIYMYLGEEGEESAFKIRNAAIEFAIACNEVKPEFIKKYMNEIWKSMLGK